MVRRKKKNWDPKRVERLKEFRQTCIPVWAPWLLDVGTNARSRVTEAQEKKKRKGKKERVKLKATQGEKEEGGTTGMIPTSSQKSQSQKRKRRELHLYPLYFKDDTAPFALGHNNKSCLFSVQGLFCCFASSTPHQTITILLLQPCFETRKKRKW
jgi:hypothetical protein